MTRSSSVSVNSVVSVIRTELPRVRFPVLPPMTSIPTALSTSSIRIEPAIATSLSESSVMAGPSPVRAIDPVVEIVTSLAVPPSPAVDVAIGVVRSTSTVT